MMKNKIKILQGLLLLLLIPCAFGQPTHNHTTQNQTNSRFSPPMGWNSWNWFGRNINEKLILETIDAFSKQGLSSAGYRYIVIDGGWRANHLDPNNALIIDSNKFPHGIKYLANYAHNHGLKLGLHIVAGAQDCAKNWTGSKGHEALHLRQLLSWNIDFIKLDKCLINNDESWAEETSNSPYHKWGELLKPYADKIFLSLSFYHYQDWYPLIGKTGRTTNDIKPKIFGGAVFDQKDSGDFLSVMEIAEINNRYASKAGLGYWNDPDMLVVGDQHLSLEEQKAHFALWCIMTAPLMLGNDIRTLPDLLKDIILNKEAINIDQDPSEQGKKIVKDGAIEVWAKHLSDGSMAVLLLNRDKNKAIKISLPIRELGIRTKFAVYDIYQSKLLGTFDRSFSSVIKPQSGLFIKITTVNSSSAYWDTQRKGANIFNENMNSQIWQDAAKANIKLVRLAPDKWHGKQKDFLIGNADHYTGLVSEDLKQLKKVLADADKQGIKVVLTLLSLPGDRWKQLNGGKDDDRIWHNQQYQQQAIRFWKDLALALKGNPAIVGYNFINEPHPEVSYGYTDFESLNLQKFNRVTLGTSADLTLFYQKIADAVRTVDPITPLILDAGMYADPRSFSYFKPIHGENILYAFHMYEPYDYTNKKLNKDRYAYPGIISIGYDHTLIDINKSSLQSQYLKSVLDWQNKYHIPNSRIYVEEFGGHRMTKGLDIYFRDLISIFNEHHWHWTFYSFREDTWDGMDYELGAKPLGAKYWDAVAKGEHPETKKVQNNIWDTVHQSLAITG